MGFDPCNRALKIRESIGTPIPNMGVHLGVWGFIPSHSFALPRACNVTRMLPSWLATSQAFALVVSARLRLRQFSPRRLYEWIFTIVSTLFSYHSRSHFMSNCTYPLGNSPFNCDQTFKCLSHCHWGNVVLIHKLHFMPSLSWCLCNVFLPTPIQSSNQGGCEAVIHGIICTLDLRFNLVVF
jgi:hypothetical protein